MEERVLFSSWYLVMWWGVRRYASKGTVYMPCGVVGWCLSFLFLKVQLGIYIMVFNNL